MSEKPFFNRRNTIIATAIITAGGIILIVCLHFISVPTSLPPPIDLLDNIILIFLKFVGWASIILGLLGMILTFLSPNNKEKLND